MLRRRGAHVAILDRVISGGRPDVPSASPATSPIAAVDRAAIDCGRREDSAASTSSSTTPGIGAVGDITANDDDEWHRVLDVNVVGIARVTRAALPYLRRSEHAAIVNTCSVVATVGRAAAALYSASKGAVAALTLAMAADHVGEGIRVNAVTPGTADTPWVGRLLDQADGRGRGRAALRARQPMGRLVTADEVAHAIAYLAGPLSRRPRERFWPSTAGWPA